MELVVNRFEIDIVMPNGDLVILSVPGARRLGYALVDAADSCFTEEAPDTWSDEDDLGRR